MIASERRQDRASPPSGGDERRPVMNAPGVVSLLFALMIAVRAFQSVVSDDRESWLLLRLALIPARYDEANGLVYPGGWAADVWVFVTHMFLHGGWLHLAVNGFFMLAFGTVLARRFGAGRFLVFSLLSGVGAALAHLWIYWGDQAPLIGASGAVSGQMAGAVRLMFVGGIPVHDAHREDARRVEVPGLARMLTNPRALAFVAIWVAVTILAGTWGVMAPESGSIAWEAHLGGFAVGMTAFGAFDRISRRPPGSKP